MQTISATYSPEDNKLRLYTVTRLDEPLYQRVKAAGFSFAPKQDLFVAPMWTPSREDLLIELCGQIDDENTSLVERAELRADRFDGYGDRRMADANAAHAAVSAIVEHIPLGQPILVGHHSEARARKDAARIDNGMRRAVNMWDTAEYWKRRAAAALRHAERKEAPDVRHRRIKKLEAEQRKHERTVKDSEVFRKLWSKECLTMEQSSAIAARDYVYLRDAEGNLRATVYTLLEKREITIEEAARVCIAHHDRQIAFAQRWISHYTMRVTYERAMLNEDGGDFATRFDFVVGGRVLIDGEWLVLLRLNKSQGVVSSVTTQAPRHVHWRKEWKYGIERVKGYRAPEPEEAKAVADAVKQPPLANFPGDGFLHLTRAEWAAINKDYKGVRVADATVSHGAYRFRRALRSGTLHNVYLTDAKRVDPPVRVAAAPMEFDRRIEPSVAVPPERSGSQMNEFEQLRERLAAGVQVVSAPQLFPTPTETAADMATRADIKAGQRILEPNAGTGRILSAISQLIDRRTISITAVDVNLQLCRIAQASFNDIRVVHSDFLACSDELGQFDRILMNPPFSHGQDIAHILHALKFLAPGGRLVAICADGPKQAEVLAPLVQTKGGVWEPLPEGTFRSEGTNVRTVMIVIDL